MTTKTMIVAVIGQKGGSGKTTTSLGLGVAAAEDGRTPLIIDIDQQANATKWRDRRKIENIAVIGAVASRIKPTIETAVAHGADFIVIDTPGHSDSAAIEAARSADMIILPVEPQMLHFETLNAMRDLIRIAGDKPTWILLNRVHPAATIQAKKLKIIIADSYSMQVCPIHLSRFDIYGTSADIGLTPLEQEPKGRAAEEIRSLYKFTSSQINKLRSSHVKNTKLAAGA